MQAQDNSELFFRAARANDVKTLKEMLGRGFETRRISEELHIGIKTVQAYCARIKEKLDLKNATALLREAVLWGQREKPQEQVPP